MNNKKALFILRIIKSIVEIFVNSFFVMYFLSISNQNIMKLGIYYIIVYLIVYLFIRILGNYSKGKKRINLLRVGIILNLVYFLLILFLKEDIIKYAYIMAIIYGLEEGFYYSVYNNFESLSIKNSDRASFAGFYTIINSNYIFSEEVLTKTKQILSYDIDVVSLYEETVNFISNQMAGFAPNEASRQNEILNLTQNEQENENLVQETNGVGGVEPDTTFIEEALATTQEEIPQTDEEYIKNHFSFIKPIEGIVSSEFGKRDSQNPIVSKNHTGIDIAANTGTVIKASMEGTVSISSTQGDYGYHIKIVNGDVSTLYAHCSKLYVNQGDIITQGQEIGEVGTTGKSTGPHLHFEIMRGQNYINPRSILEF